MQQSSWKIRLIFAIGLLGVSAYFLYPSLVYFSLGEEQIKEVRQNKENFKNYLPDFFPKSHIVPGLDLQGGIHMVLGVDLDKAISDKTSRAMDRFLTFAKDEGIKIESAKQIGESPTLKDKVLVTLSSDEDVEKLKKNIQKKFFDFYLFASQDKVITLKLDQNLSNSIRNDAIDQTIKTVTNRIDKMGVTEPSISKRGQDQVQIQLAGYDDPEQAKNLLGRTAQLQFQMCDDEATFLKDLKDLPAGVELKEGGYSRSELGSAKDIYLSFNENKLSEVKEYLSTKTPAENIIRFGREDKRGMAANDMMRTYTLKRKVELTGDDLIDAKVSQGSDTNPRPGVSLTFGPTGAKIFAAVTEKSIGKRMAIVLEDLVDSAPVISTKIPDGNAFISMGGARTTQEMLHDANQLAIVLKSGALPAPVTFREERTVGPSLGKDSIEQGKIAFIVGTLIIALFMMFYYRLSGFFAMIGVFFSMAFILAIMSFLGATITLPGIAALLLTIGMAVDSNVIINERIREELRLGKIPRSAVKTGYDAAMSAVVDTHVTTFISGIVLWQFGTGPVQNFATMLLIGTVSSIITAIFITRIFLDSITANGQKTLSI